MFTFCLIAHSCAQAFNIDDGQLGGTGAFGAVEAVQVGYGPVVNVSVSTNGGEEWFPAMKNGNFSSKGDGHSDGEKVFFEYHPPFLLGSLDPLSGPAIGGTLVTVSLNPTAVTNDLNSTFSTSGNASEFSIEWPFSFDTVRDTSAACLFNGTSVPATVVSNSSVECVTPPTVSGGGISFVRVSVNGVEVFGGTAPDATSDASYGTYGTLPFFYLPDEEEMYIFPVSGPVKGGTQVEVSSRHIANAATALFLSQALEEEFNDGNYPKHNHTFPLRLPPSSAMCSFGEGATVAAFGLSFDWDGIVNADGRETGVGHVLCVSPPASGDLPSPVTVEVSLNGGRDFTKHGPQFYYRPEAQVSNVEPSYGPIYGGNPVRVEGGPFRDEAVGRKNSEQILRCRFGDQEVGATIHTAGLVGCRAPPMRSVPEEQDIEVKMLLGGGWIESLGKVAGMHMTRTTVTLQAEANNCHSIWTRTVRDARQVSYCCKYQHATQSRSFVPSGYCWACTLCTQNGVHEGGVTARVAYASPQPTIPF